MISVIIPTYNRAHLIERAINSVLNQTYRDFELLIVDDGSTDNTEEVVGSIVDERIRYIKCEQNGGAAKARNRGIEEARYEYIAFQDSDDEWHADKLEKQMKIMLESADDVGFVYCEYFYHGLEGRNGYCPDKKIPLEMKSGYIFPRLLRGNLVGTPTMLVKKECFENVGVFNEHFPCFEDWELVLRIARQYKIAFVPECLMEVYATWESVTNNLDGYLKTKCILAGAYKKELLEYDLFNEVVGTILKESEKFGKQDLVVKYLEVVLSR